jgi:hypothetical protein
MTTTPDPTVADVIRRLEARIVVEQQEKLIAALTRAVTPDAIALTIKKLMTATIRTKDGRRIPDYRTRLSALKLFLGYLGCQSHEFQPIHQDPTEP